MICHFPACILFDLDGTLVDSLPGIEFSVKEAFNACKLPYAKGSLREMIGPHIRTILARAGNVADERTLDALEGAFRASYDADGWRKTVCFPDANRALRVMRDRQYRLFVVTNKPRHVSLQILEEQRILDHFEAIVTRDSRLPEYPGKKEMIAGLLSERAIATEQCLMVGDTTEDASAAASAGIKFIWMTHGYGTMAPVSSIPVVPMLDSFLQLLRLIDQGAFRD